MSDCVQITSIICATIIIVFYLTTDKSNSENRYKGKIGHNPSPTFPRPPRPGYQPDISSVEKIKNVKPPKTGSGIK